MSHTSPPSPSPAFVPARTWASTATSPRRSSPQGSEVESRKPRKRRSTSGARSLTALAEDFYSGQARVEPKHYPKTCAHCDQRLLCRLDPATLDANSLDEDSATDAPAGPFDSASEENARG